MPENRLKKTRAVYAQTTTTNSMPSFSLYAPPTGLIVSAASDLEVGTTITIEGHYEPLTWRERLSEWFWKTRAPRRLRQYVITDRT